MKLRSIAITLLASCALFSQDPAAINFVAFRTATGIRIDGTLNNKALPGTASSIQHDNSTRVVHLQGNVEITVNGIRLAADEVTMHEDSGEIETSGNVRLSVPK